VPYNEQASPRIVKRLRHLVADQLGSGAVIVVLAGGLLIAVVACAAIYYWL
jgi:hypothetical protein